MKDSTTGILYYFHTGLTYNWQAAYDYCVNLGMILAVTDTQAKLDLLIRIAQPVNSSPYVNKPNLNKYFCFLLFLLLKIGVYFCKSNFPPKSIHFSPK